MLSAGGAKFLMLSALLYAPGTILFVIARREQNRPVFTRVEWLSRRHRRGGWSPASTVSLRARSQSTL